MSPPDRLLGQGFMLLKPVGFAWLKAHRWKDSEED